MQEKGRTGTVSSDANHVLTVEWNDLESCEEILVNHSDEIACFISSPYNHPVSRDNELPAEG